MSAWYKFVRFLGKIFLFFGPPVTVSGCLPAGPAVLFCNHYSFLDPPLLGILLDRRVWFLATPKVFKWKIIGWLVKKSNWALPISSDHKFALKNAAKLLRQGKSIVLFPEGTRSNSIAVQNFKPGVCFLSYFATAVPIAIKGTYESLPRGKWWPSRHPIKIIIGQPLKIPQGKDYSLISKLAKQEIIQLLQKN